ncbi:MAG: tetratricopeptide repeat protein [Elusimicrobia bacterium]|nr:tetratricopeptide repeat protein [Elusimicrobiota bacterium]
MNGLIRAAFLCVLLSGPVHPTGAGESGTALPGGKIDLKEALLAGGAAEEEMAAYAPIVGEAIKILENLPDRNLIHPKIKEIVDQEVALVEGAQAKKQMAAVLTLSLGNVAMQISRIEKRKPVAKPKDEIKNRQPPPVPPTPMDIRKGANEYVTTHLPDNRSGWNNTAYDAMQEKDYRTALRAYKKVIELGGGNPEVYTGYGNAAYHLGDAEGAYESARQALEIDLSYLPAEALRNLSERRIREVSPSKKMLEDAAALADGGGKLLAAAGPSGSPVAAVAGGPSGKLGPQAGAGAPGIPAQAVRQAEDLVSQAAGALGLREFEQGAVLAGRAATLDPLNAQAWTLRAVADANLGKHGDAVYDASFALLLVPGDATARRMRSWSFSKTGKFTEALRDSDYALAKEPDDPFAHYDRAFAQAGLRDREGALASLKKAAELDERFQRVFDAALAAPRHSDMLLLFDLMGPGSGLPAPGSRAQRRFPRWAVASLAVAGGLLAGLGVAAAVLAFRRRAAGVR